MKTKKRTGWQKRNKDLELDLYYRDKARELYREEGVLEIDANAKVSGSMGGAYVAAWVWVDHPINEVPINKDTTRELNAIDVLSKRNLKSKLVLTPTELRKHCSKAYTSPKRYRIVYFHGDETDTRVATQQKVLQFAKETGGFVFTGIHSESDWSKTAYWAAGWHRVNRTGEYAVVIKK